MSASPKRTICVQLKLDPDEKATLDDLAARLKLARTDILRLALRAYAVRNGVTVEGSPSAEPVDQVA